MLEIQTEELKSEQLNGDIDYVASDFCKANKLGFRGELGNKEGFILGPSIFKTTDKSDPEEMKTYELFAPTVYLKDINDDNIRRPYKLIVAKFN